uniref:Nicotinate phosphoribosyltransferase n=1 Tax=Pinguiococcus pyrenoidosus TaxID=172671 RepID=A0A7R9YCN9_9STRA|mmetsp:Transcript_2959/g.11984  ORF Transcript_2959/g.11984 Transcript_2959/m.11984 type:complete len:568 (+) Transcript_2959:65-1768(+)
MKRSGEIKEQDGTETNGKKRRRISSDDEDLKPTNPLVSPLLTDLYQLTMAYGHWKAGRHEDHSVFDLYFRKNPFRGEFTIFAGLEEVLKHLRHFHFSDGDLEYVAELLKPEPEFIEWLASVDCRKIKVCAIAEGSVVFPREPLLRIEGPLAVAQLLETTFLNLVNYPSLVATNAARMRLAAGSDKLLMEFGLRRAQGPDGAVSASRYSYVGGFDATSNVLAGKLTNIPVKGTHAHAYVQAYSGIDDLRDRRLGDNSDFAGAVLKTREELGFHGAHDGELAAFISYAQAFPSGFLALVDTYDTLTSGVPNFIAVAIELIKLGKKPVGIRLDSGDLSYFSKKARQLLREAAEKSGFAELAAATIIASNDLNEQVIHSLNQEGHEIDGFGIGTHLVTCQAQPALGCVYKLVEINNRPRIKLSQDISKVSLPGSKQVYRLYGSAGHPLVDLMLLATEEPPLRGKRILCRHPLEAAKRCYVTPAEVEPLLQVVWDGAADTNDVAKGKDDPSDTDGVGPLFLARKHALAQLERLRDDHLREVNPTPYKVSVSEKLYEYMHELWEMEAPIMELS